MPFDFTRYLANLEEAKRRLDIPVDAEQLNKLALLDAGFTPAEMGALTARPLPQLKSHPELTETEGGVSRSFSALDLQRRDDPYYEAESLRVEDYFYILYKRRPLKAPELGKRVKAAFAAGLGQEPKTETTWLPMANQSKHLYVYPDYWLDETLKNMEGVYSEHWE